MSKAIVLQDTQSIQESTNSDVRQADADVIEARRIAQFRYRMRGLKRKEILERLATEFNASRSQVDEDWKCRNSWIKRVAELTNTDALIAEIQETDSFAQQQLREVVHEINILLEEGSVDGGLDMSEDSPTITLLAFKERYIKALRDGNKIFLENMAKLGIVREAPKRLEINEIQHKIDWGEVTKDMKQEKVAELFDALQRGRQD